MSFASIKEGAALYGVLDPYADMFTAHLSFFFPFSCYETSTNKRENKNASGPILLYCPFPFIK